MSHGKSRQIIRKPSPRKMRGGEHLMPASATTFEVVEAVSGTLREKFRHERHAAKRLAEIGDSSVRAAENWIEGRDAMTLAQFVTLARRMPEFKALAVRMMEIETAINPEIERALSDLMRATRRNEEIKRASSILDRADNGGGNDATAAHEAVRLARAAVGRVADPPREMDDAAD